MRYLVPLFSLAFIFGALGDQTSRTPVIVELFTSEGCSSCPPADALLKNLSEKQDVAGAMIIPLGFHVDYWDNLGWKDRFSSPLFTKRQQDYRDGLRLRSAYTPQMIVDGSQQFLGSDQNAARAAIQNASRTKLPVLSISVKPVDDKSAGQLDVTISTEKLPPGDLYIAVTEAGLTSEVRSGENAGRKIPHAPVVRSLQKMGAMSMPSSTATIVLQKEWKMNQLHIVAFVQQSDDLKITAAGQASLK